MRIDAVSLQNFRNYKSESVSFSPGTNVIIGENAQGKTNLLEAIYFLAIGHSFRTRTDRELIRMGEQMASLEAKVFSDDRAQQMEVQFHQGKTKIFLVNHVKQKNFSQLAGRFTAVLFCPNDLSLIREGASERRKLMDHCICQLRPKYSAALSAFNRAYEQKTRILRDWREKPDLLKALDEYSEVVAEKSAELIYYRSSFVRRLEEEAKKVHREFSGEREELTLSYKTVSTITDAAAGPSALYLQLIEHWQKHRQAEIDSGLCLSGAHKDDIEIHINSLPAKSFASQGQMRTAALSIKLGEREIMYRDRGEYPVLLLDDVLSELDASRQNFILNRISEGQVFITGCEDQSISQKTGGKILTVEKGSIC